MGIGEQDLQETDTTDVSITHVPRGGVHTSRLDTTWLGIASCPHTKLQQTTRVRTATEKLP